VKWEISKHPAELHNLRVGVIEPPVLEVQVKREDELISDPRGRLPDSARGTSFGSSCDSGCDAHFKLSGNLTGNPKVSSLLSKKRLETLQGSDPLDFAAE
jgi:hypothetical protein